ncbi:MAG: hypothetical protein U1F20_01925 [Lysobacterales bacterium]
MAEQRGRRSRNKTSNSFSFTSWWADAVQPADYWPDDFAKTFFAKHSLLNVPTRYCSISTWIASRGWSCAPYQIVAAERIPQRIATYKSPATRKNRGWWLYSAYHWQRQDPDQFQGSATGAHSPRNRLLFVAADRKD